MSTKGWNAIIWGVYTQRLDYLKILFEQSTPNLSLALDVNSEKSMFPEGNQVEMKTYSLDEQYLGKGRAQGLVIAILHRNWEIFKYVHDKCYKYLMGSQVFTVFRAFVDQQWLDGGLFLYL
jgi:hypothetical protein